MDLDPGVEMQWAGGAKKHMQEGDLKQKNR